MLVCLELYDEVQALKTQITKTDDEKAKVAAMIDKINQQARSML